MLRISTVILFVVVIFAGVYALLTIALPDAIEGITFQAITGEELNALERVGYLKPYRVIARHEGLFAITTVIPVGFILFYGYRKGFRWAWWTALCTARW
jgi:hypothetical protein